MDRTVATWALDGKGLAFYDILFKVSQWSICQQSGQDKMKTKQKIHQLYFAFSLILIPVLAPPK
jgi:hypothetical protein